MADISYFAAALAGLVSFVSPCILPIVPAYLGFISSSSVQDMQNATQRARWLMIVPRAGAFVLGLSSVLIALGVTASGFGRMISLYFDWLAILAGLAMMLLGLHLLGWLRIPLLMREWRNNQTRRPIGLAGAFLIGIAFGFGWTPCVGPVLAGILLVAAAQETMVEGGLLLAAYAFGLGVPFILVAAFTSQAMQVLQRLKPAMPLVERVAGASLVLTGLFIATGWMPRVAGWLYEAFPVFARIG